MSFHVEQPRDTQLLIRKSSRLEASIPEFYTLQTRSATKRARSPDDRVQPSHRRATTRSNETLTLALDADVPAGEAPGAPRQTAIVPATIAPATDEVARRRAAARGAHGWTLLRSWLADAIHQVRILLFDHIVDVRKCFQTRCRLQYLSRRQ
jgi:hypothetical protein